MGWDGMGCLEGRERGKKGWGSKQGRAREHTVIAPQPAGLRVPSQVEGCELHVPDRELF